MHAATEEERLGAVRIMNDVVDNYVPLMPMVAELESAFVQPCVKGFHGAPFITYYYQYLDIDVGKQRLADKR